MGNFLVLLTFGKTSLMTLCFFDVCLSDKSDSKWRKKGRNAWDNQKTNDDEEEEEEPKYEHKSEHHEGTNTGIQNRMSTNKRGYFKL